MIGVSLLSGAHMALIPRILDRMRAANAEDILLVAGGVFPDEDEAALRRVGVAEIFGQDTPPDAIVGRIRELVAARRSG